MDDKELLRRISQQQQNIKPGEMQVLSLEFIAMYVRVSRRSRGWKKATLATFADVSLSTVERVERAEKVSKENLDRIAQALGEENGTFYEPRRRLTPEELAAQNALEFETVLVRPLRTQSLARELARCHSYIIRSSAIDDSHQERVAKLQDWLDGANFLLSGWASGTVIDAEVGRREIYEGILAAVEDFNRNGVTVLAGTLAAPRPGIPEWKVGVVDLTLRRSDPGATKRQFILLDRRFLSEEAFRDAMIAGERFNA
ncbi:helix-turn-helix domain-containing protein [Microvirga yunnanensis]|uniref:helix-turn-helix domain-containing protein n=1 Tax=Microvirga yunnanensis TaxID=2953740 RepID=UPI0021CA108F|nr:helix-turn-helix transcriptional regulator [Microvirga sp. HBU65207]